MPDDDPADAPVREDVNTTGSGPHANSNAPPIRKRYRPPAPRTQRSQTTLTALYANPTQPKRNRPFTEQTDSVSAAEEGATSEQRQRAAGGQGDDGTNPLPTKRDRQKPATDGKRQATLTAFYSTTSQNGNGCTPDTSASRGEDAGAALTGGATAAGSTRPQGEGARPGGGVAGSRASGGDRGMGGKRAGLPREPD